MRQKTMHHETGEKGTFYSGEKWTKQIGVDIGNSHFVQEVLKEADERLRRQLKTIASGKTIDNIIDEECSKGNINPNELRNRGVRKHITLCRAKVALRAIAELGLSAAEIARNLGVTTSTITRAIKRLEKREKI